MKQNVRANIEFAVNIVIALAIVVVAGVVVKRNLFPRQQVNPENLPRITTGERLSLPNVDWAQNKKTLVFFLMKNCKYCKAEAPFYRQLIADASERNVKWLAVLPDSVEEGRKYVQSLDLPIENVQTGSLASYKIPGTPSVLYLDDQGVVKFVCIGASPSRETEIRDELVKLFGPKASNDFPTTKQTLNNLGGPQPTAPIARSGGIENAH